ncbi:tRNA-uridine aminocarboxypropyltransferase [Cognaticolwellia mytili]|uniref:tRNA-uridine aminocarboxypropyltransferase n=1 Tax=Cognaticolwellia mytili TaxID=1888913 RepID=UPI001F2BD0CB|nr:tRNA-uridine aminocarboxypropyltransferase [Cognaticolwellia mytili]
MRRGTNTGVIAIEDANNIVERIPWERLNPNKDLVRLIENNQAVLLYSKGELSSTGSPAMPSAEPQTEEPIVSSAVSKVVSTVMSKVGVEAYENIIIIDSTWQEANKIFNQSSYLKNAPQFTLKTTNDSSYKLRANQPKGGLCTIECIIEVLRLKGQDKLAAELSVKFEQFNG